MRSVQPDESRRALRLVEAVESCFAFLAEFGFRLVSSDLSLVRYESPVVFVNVFQSRGGYDLGFEIGQLAHPKDRLSTTEVLLLAGAPPLPELFRPDSPESMKSGMCELAQLMRRYGEDALRSAPEPFENVRELRRKYTEQFMRQDTADPTSG